MKIQSLFGVCALLSLSLVTPGRADAVGHRLRLLAQKHAASLVTVSLVITASASSDPLELEAEGIVIDSTGLVATTNTAIDPTSLRAGSDEIVTNVTGAKILLPGGVEVPARLVLRDKDRNLAFLRPLRPLNLPALPFATAKGKAEQGDEVTLLGRLGKAGKRLSSIENVRLLGVMQQPRTLYVLPTAYLARLGEAAFDESGRLIGLVSMRVSPTSRASLNQTDQYVAAIVPASDVWAVAIQAPPLKKSDADSVKSPLKVAPKR